MDTTPSEKQFNVQETIIKLANGESVLMDGPLSLQCSNELMRLYEKKPGDVLSVGLESHQEDLARSIGIWGAIVSSGDLPLGDQDRIAYLYSVRQGDVTISDVVRFVQTLGSMDPTQVRAGLYMPDQEELNILANEMSSAAADAHVPVFTAMEQVVDFFNHTKR